MNVKGSKTSIHSCDLKSSGKKQRHFFWLKPVIKSSTCHVTTIFLPFFVTRGLTIFEGHDHTTPLNLTLINFLCVPSCKVPAFAQRTTVMRAMVILKHLALLWYWLLGQKWTAFSPESERSEWVKLKLWQSVIIHYWWQEDSLLIRSHHLGINHDNDRVQSRLKGLYSLCGELGFPNGLLHRTFPWCQYVCKQCTFCSFPPLTESYTAIISLFVSKCEACFGAVDPSVSNCPFLVLVCLLFQTHFQCFPNTQTQIQGFDIAVPLLSWTSFNKRLFWSSDKARVFPLTSSYSGNTIKDSWSDIPELASKSNPSFEKERVKLKPAAWNSCLFYASEPRQQNFWNLISCTCYDIQERMK